MVRRFGLGLFLSVLLVSLTLAQPKIDFPVVNPAVAKLVRTIESLPGIGVGFSVSDEKRFVLFGCEDGTLRLYPLEEEKEPLADISKIRSWKPHNKVMTALAGSGSVAASSYSDGKVFLWNLPAEKPTHTLSIPTIVRAVGVSADGKQIATVGDDKIVHLWDSASGNEIRKLTGPTDWLLAVAFSPDGKFVAGGGHDGRIWVWDAGSGAKKFDEVIQSAPPPKDTKPIVNVVHSVAFSPDSKTLSVGASDGRIYQFTTDNGKLARQLQGHTGVVTALVYHPGNTFLASASKDRSVRLWQANGGALKTLEGHTAWVEGLALIEKGSILLSTGADRTVRVWDLGAKPTKPKKK